MELTQTVKKGKEEGRVKKKVAWLILSCLMVLSLVLASCAPAVTEEEEAPPVVEEEEEVVEEEVVVPAVGEPQYGGVLNFCLGASPQGWDQAFAPQYTIQPGNLVNEQLFIGDWARGPAGTAETGWLLNLCPPLDFLVGSLAESWEIVDPLTFRFHIREGVRWQDKPPVNGRELTADDVAFSFKHVFENPTSVVRTFVPGGKVPESYTVTDKYTLEVKCVDEAVAPVLLEFFLNRVRILAPEVIEKYGDMRDWRSVVGTGPFVVKDEVPGSSVTLVRNPYYWGKDPVHPEKDFPYLDGVRYLVIEDASTRVAAMRTGKIDIYRGFTWEEGEALLETNPELEYLRYPFGTPWQIFMRMDKLELPFHDLRVRRALAMAIDNETIAKDYYGGNAQILAAPVIDVPDNAAIYIPLDELPESTRELYEYHPDKARQLLAEAGYPDGFETELVCFSGAGRIDLLTIVQGYWADIGVDVKLDVKEWGVFRSTAVGRTHEQMIERYGSNQPFAMTPYRPGSSTNMGFVDDPLVNETYPQLWGENYYDSSKRAKLYRDLLPHILSQAWIIQPPCPYIYVIWQPWVGSYHGEYALSFVDDFNFIQYLWLDQDLKKSMGH